MAPLGQANERLAREFSIMHHMQAVTGDDAWQKAFAGMLAQVHETASRLGQHRGLRDRITLLAADPRAGLSPVRRRIADEALIDFEHAGAGLPAAQRRKLRSLQRRTAQLAARFERNLRDATASGHVQVEDERALAAMPADIRQAYRQSSGGWRFPLLDPSCLAVIRHCGDRSARRQMLLLRNARASSLGPRRRDNTPIIAQIVRLRREQAQLLGYASYADLILARRMAQSPQEVFRLAGQIAAPARRAARRDMAMLAKFAARECGIGKLKPWDVAYVGERLREKEFGVPEQEIRSYFEVDAVLDGLFACIRSLFGIVVRPQRAPAWHPCVKAYALADEDGTPRGLLYMDLDARPGKQGGAWAHDLQVRCRFGRRTQLPAAVICCSFTASGKGEAARLGWEEVVTLYHEMGHALHNLLTDQDDYAASGMNMVEWDAIELPSQFMENFAWRREAMRAMSRNASTGRPLPPRLCSRLAGERTYLAGLRTMRQLGFLAYDLILHGEGRGLGDPLALWRKVRNEYAVAPTLRGDRTPCAFGHVFGGGYAAGYYSYLWAEVLSADAYSMFAQRGARLAASGRRFRYEVLARGGSRTAGENFSAFRGRSPQVAALLRQMSFA